MAKTQGRSSLLPFLALAAVLAPGGAATPPGALAATQESVRDARGWMPDVAERREDLARREDHDAHEEGRRSLATEQWWRGVAAAPVQGRLP